MPILNITASKAYCADIDKQTECELAFDQGLVSVASDQAKAITINIGSIDKTANNTVRHFYIAY